MRDDVIVRKPRINLRLEDLDFLARDLGAAQAANQLFRFARKHRAGNHFNPTGTRNGRMFFARGDFIFIWLDTANHFGWAAHLLSHRNRTFRSLSRWERIRESALVAP